MTVDSISFWGVFATLESKPIFRTSPQCSVRFSFYHNHTASGAVIVVRAVEDWGINTTSVVYSMIHAQFVESADSWTSMTVGVGARPIGRF